VKSICIESPEVVKVVERPMPVVAEDCALLKIHTAGICGSDMGALKGTNKLVSYPRIIGHEIAGEVIAGPKDPLANPKHIKEGEHVVVDPYLYCGKCYPCSIGRTNCCEHLRVIGVHVDGGMSEYFAYPAKMLVPIPREITRWEDAVLAEPICISLHGVHRGGVKKGEFFIVFGAGTIGLVAALIAKHYGATPILVDVVDSRLTTARRLGVSFTINSLKEDLLAKVKDYTNGELAHCVMEASGSNAAIASTLSVVRNAGRVVFTGWPAKDTSLPTNLITFKELDVRGARTSVGEFEEALDLIRDNVLPLSQIRTKTIPIEECPKTMHEIESNPGAFLKVVVEMSRN
jgi:L-gulonate 5-dehydrogenase